MRALGIVIVGLATLGALAPEARAESLADLFEKVRGSVVTIRYTERTGRRNAQGAPATTSGYGSGVLIDGGRILTAAHVVHSADQVSVTFADGTNVRAQIIGSVFRTDVAMLKLAGAAPASAREAVLGDSDKVRIGSRCFVVGAPHGLEHTLTAGHISARRKEEHPRFGLQGFEHFQTDAAINPGNSGGPMFDMKGQVIGLAKSVVRQSEGLAFVVASNTVRRQLLERSPVWSGMTEVYITGALARALQLPEGYSGFLIQRVAKGSPADRMGLRGGSIPARINNVDLLLGGDIIVAAMGKRLDTPADGLAIIKSLGDLKPESKVTVTILRSGKLTRRTAEAGKLAPWMKK